jgi:hypothetical protein
VWVALLLQLAHENNWLQSTPGQGHTGIADHFHHFNRENIMVLLTLRGRASSNLDTNISCSGGLVEAHIFSESDFLKH